MVHDFGGLVLGIAIGIVIAWLYFLVWKVRYSAAIREDAVQRSLAVTAGKVHEQLVPYLPEFGFNPKDARFLGSPVALVVFDGLSAGGGRRAGVFRGEQGRGEGHPPRRAVAGGCDRTRGRAARQPRATDARAK